MSSGLEFDTDPIIGDPVDGLPAKKPFKTILKGRDVTLVPLDPEVHTRDLFANISGPGKDRLWLYKTEGPYHDIQLFRQYIDKKCMSKDSLIFAIIDNKTNMAQGNANYLRIVPDHGVMEVACTYGPKLQRTYGATEAMYLMAKHAFEDLGYRRYEWRCDSTNVLSRKAALRLGFEFEALFKQNLVFKGRNWDIAVYAMLDKDWPKRKRAFELWLDSKNFDHNGQQIQSLSKINEQINLEN